MKIFTPWIILLLWSAPAFSQAVPELRSSSVELGAERSLFTDVSIAGGVRDHTLLVVGSLLIREHHPHLSPRFWWLDTDLKLPKTGPSGMSPAAGGPGVVSMSAVGPAGPGMSLLAGSLSSGAFGLFKLDSTGRIAPVGTQAKLLSEVTVHRVARTAGGRVVVLGQFGGRPFAAAFDESGTLLWKRDVGEGLEGALVDGRPLKGGGFMVVGVALSGSQLKGAKEKPLMAELDAEGKIVRRLLLDKSEAAAAWRDLEIVPILSANKRATKLAWFKASKDDAVTEEVLPVSESILVREIAFPLKGGNAVVVDGEGRAPRVRIVDRHGAVLKQEVFSDASMIPVSMTAVMADGVLYIAGPAFRLENGKELRGFIRVLAVRLGE